MIWAIGVVSLGLLATVAVLALVAASARRETAAAAARVTELENSLRSLEAELQDARRPSSAPTHPAVQDPAAAGAGGGGRTHGMTDPETGLFNQEFFRVALDSRVSAARRQLRPVAVVLAQVAGGVREGSPQATPAPVVAEAVRVTLRDADTACRLDDGRFALILEDTPENGAVWTVERVRRALAGAHPGQTLWAGIACYPAHAFDADELLERAGIALVAAQEWRQDRIEVASPE